MNKLKHIIRLLPLMLSILGLTGCVQANEVVVDPAANRNFLVGGVGLVIFGLTLLYAGGRAFLAFNETTDGVNAEGRIQMSGFGVGILLSVLIMAVDVAPASLPTSALFRSLPLGLLIIFGIFGGLFVGLASAVIANIRRADTAGLVILTLSFLSSTGIYLLLFTNTQVGLVLATFVSILIGLLIIRMIFPYSPADEQGDGNIEN